MRRECPLAPRVLVAPDSFKGTFAASQVADAVANGLARAGLDADRCPVADGGEGTMDAVLAARGGRVIRTEVRDPLGRKVEAAFALLDHDRTALVETAAASGLGLVAAAERDPWLADTYGTGELICAALDAGAERILLAAGGSATVDGGSGALRALAARPGGLGGTQLVVLCDVRTPWERCAAIFGPQKGADHELVRRLAGRLDGQARRLPRDPRGVPGTGAAGGLSGALWAVYSAALEPGASCVLDVVGFDNRLDRAAAVICGEGRLDSQSTEGKVVSEIAARANTRGVFVHAIVGRRALDETAQRAIGIESIVEATTLTSISERSEELGRRIAIMSRARAST
jgi:glycerate 2-kinase